MNTLSEIGERIRTQDNRITSHPIFFVEVLEYGRWVRIQPFFTRVAAQAFIAANSDDYEPGELRIYIASGYSNPEWRAVRDALKDETLRKPPHPRSVCGECEVEDKLREEVDRLRDLVRRLADHISRLYLDPDAEKRGAALLAEADKELNR